MNPRRPAAILLICLALLSAGCVSTKRGTVPTPSAASPSGLTVDPTALSEALTSTAKDYHLPGAIAGVWVPDAPAWVEAIGPIAEDDRFPIRSVTKSFTVTLLLMLVEEGEVSLDEPISDYVEGVPNGEEITLRDLTAMTSGLVDYSQTKPFQEKFADDFQRQWTPRQLLDFAFDEKPLYEPGEGYNYSNTNTVLIGQVVEQVSGVSLEELYDTRIWAPLAMGSTTYPDNAHIPTPHAPPYLIDPSSGASEPAPVVNLSALGASGGMVSTLQDLRAWAEALGAGTLVGPTMQLDRQEAAQEVSEGPEYDRYGLGIGEIDGWWGHTGEGIGYNAAVFRQAGTGAIIVVLVNSSQEENAATRIFQALAAEVGTPI